MRSAMDDSFDLNKSKPCPVCLSGNHNIQLILDDGSEIPIEQCHSCGFWCDMHKWDDIIRTPWVDINERTPSTDYYVPIDLAGEIISACYDPEGWWSLLRGGSVSVDSAGYWLDGVPDLPDPN